MYKEGFFYSSFLPKQRKTHIFSVHAMISVIGRIQGEGCMYCSPLARQAFHGHQDAAIVKVVTAIAWQESSSTKVILDARLTWPLFRSPIMRPHYAFRRHLRCWGSELGLGASAPACCINPCSEVMVWGSLSLYADTDGVCRCPSICRPELCSSQRTCKLHSSSRNSVPSSSFLPTPACCVGSSPT